MTAARRLQDKVILVLGAQGGLGSEAARSFAKEGARVIISGRSVRMLEKLAKQIEADGDFVQMYPLDMEGASPEQWAEMAERITEEHGRLDGLFHAAAHFQGLTPVELTDPAEIARAIHVNLTACVWATMACLPALQKSEAAVVVITLDDTARTSRPYWGGYGLANAGRHALVPMLKGELSNTAIKVIGIEPGPMRTGLRSRAYIAERDFTAVVPAQYAELCIRAMMGDDSPDSMPA